MTWLHQSHLSTTSWLHDSKAHIECPKQVNFARSDSHAFWCTHRPFFSSERQCKTTQQQAVRRNSSFHCGVNSSAQSTTSAVALRSIVCSINHLTAGSAVSMLVCSQWVVAVVCIETRRERCSMPRFSKRVRFIRHLRDMMSRRVKGRVCRSTEDDGDDESMEDAKDKALTSLITHCE